jgi:hypothetical protein
MANLVHSLGLIRTFADQDGNKTREKSIQTGGE